MFLKRNLSRLFFFSALFFLTAGGILCQPAAAETLKRQVVLILLDRTSLPDLAGALRPNLQRLLQEGALALMNTNSAGGRTPANAWATLSAGRPAVAPPEKADAYNRREKFGPEDAAMAYYRRLGEPGGAVVIPEVLVLQAANSQAKTGAKIGALGESLAAAGLKVAVLGNADLPEKRARLAGLLACDAKGSVTLGDVGPGLLRRTEGVLPLRTDYSRLLQAFKGVQKQADLIIIDVGDMARLDNLAPEVRAELLAAEKEEILRELDLFLGEVGKNIHKNRTLLMLVSPYPSREALEKNNTFGYMILAGGGFRPGLLTSPTTRRPGLVANIDLTPSILAYFGVPGTPSFYGRAVQQLPAVEPLEFLLSENQRIAVLHNLRPGVIKSYIGLQIVLLGIILLMLIWRPHLTYYLRPPLLVLGAAPLALLLLGNLTYLPDEGAYIALGVVLCVLLALAAARWSRSDLGAWSLLAGGTVLALLLDVTTGSTLMRYSLLGYDPLGGARYYGLGNEYAGVLLGAAIFSGTALLEFLKNKKGWGIYFLSSVFIILIFATGLPLLGANFGATIATFVAFVFTFPQITGRRINLRLLLVATAGIFFVGGSVFYLDWSMPVLAQSHLGRAAALLQAGDFAELYRVAAGKLALNLKLIRYTIWSRVLLVALAVLGMLAYRPVGVLRKLKQMYPILFCGLKGLCVAGAALLAANDSGIVAAATLSIFGVPPLVYLVVGQEKRK